MKNEKIYNRDKSIGGYDIRQQFEALDVKYQNTQILLNEEEITMNTVQEENKILKNILAKKISDDIQLEKKYPKQKTPRKINIVKLKQNKTKMNQNKEKIKHLREKIDHYNTENIKQQELYKQIVDENNETENIINQQNDHIFQLSQHFDLIVNFSQNGNSKEDSNASQSNYQNDFQLQLKLQEFYNKQEKQFKSIEKDSEKQTLNYVQQINDNKNLDEKISQQLIDFQKMQKKLFRSQQQLQENLQILKKIDNTLIQQEDELIKYRNENQQLEKIISKFNQIQAMYQRESIRKEMLRKENQNLYAQDNDLTELLWKQQIRDEEDLKITDLQIVIAEQELDLLHSNLEESEEQKQQILKDIEILEEQMDDLNNKYIQFDQELQANHQ